MVNIGYIAFIVNTGGGFDSNGYPIAPTKTPSTYIPCNIETLSHEYKVLVDGQYLNSAYSIYIDNSKLQGVDFAGVDSVSLQNYEKADLGIFQIQLRETLSLVNQTKVIV